MSHLLEHYRESVLNVDLTTGWIEQTTLPWEWTRDFLGGRGIAARLLWDMIKIGNPCDPAAPLIFSTGTLAGTNAPMSGRATVTCVSPVTGQYFKANVGGHLAVTAKLNGIDHILVHGVAKKPTYIWIDNGIVELRNADDLWGKRVRETTRLLGAKHGKGVSVTCIGPAGENRVAYASIMTSCYNAAGRGGVGMLMGSKALKAIVIARPKGVRRCADQISFRRVVAEIRDALYADTMAQSYYRLGTAAGISLKNELGTLPSYNFRRGFMNPIKELTSEHWNESGKLARRVGCASCLYSCHRHVRVDEGQHAGTYSGGPEYESVAALGPGTGVSSIGAVQQANELCNDLGLDTISAGGVIQWLMETQEKGLLPKRYETGFDLSFGSEDALIKLPVMIAERAGIGDLLAEGSRAAAERIGGESWKWAIQARGLEQSRVETRCTMGYALAFAVNPRGPDHLHTQCLGERGNTPEARELIAQITGSQAYARADIIDQRGEIVRWHEDIYAASDALGLCSFTTTAAYGSTPKRMSALFAALTGFPIDGDMVMLSGRRIVTLERLLNLRLGWTHNLSNDTPWRILHETFHDRAGREYTLAPDTLASMVREYYALHGWDLDSGVPSDEVLKQLGLDLLPLDGTPKPPETPQET